MRVERMTHADLEEAIGAPLAAADLVVAVSRVAARIDEGRLLELCSRIRVNASEFPVLVELASGRAVGVELALFGCAVLKVHTLGELVSPETFDYCARREALEAALAMALGRPGEEPAGWCRASRLCCAREEVRPEACGRGSECRWHGWRQEWSR